MTSKRTPFLGLPLYQIDDRLDIIGDYNPPFIKLDDVVKDLKSNYDGTIDDIQIANNNADAALRNSNKAIEDVNNIDIIVTGAKREIEEIRTAILESDAGTHEVLWSMSENEETGDIVCKIANPRSIAVCVTIASKDRVDLLTSPMLPIALPAPSQKAVCVLPGAYIHVGVSNDDLHVTVTSMANDSEYQFYITKITAYQAVTILTPDQ